MGDEVTSLPEMGDLAGQHQFNQELGQAWAHWSDQFPDVASMADQVANAAVQAALRAFNAAAAGDGLAAASLAAAGFAPLQLTIPQSGAPGPWLVGSSSSGAAGPGGAAMATQQQQSAPSLSTGNGSSSSQGSSNRATAAGAAAAGTSTTLVGMGPAAALQVPQLGPVPTGMQQAGQSPGLQVPLQVPGQQQPTMGQSVKTMMDGMMRLALGLAPAAGPAPLDVAAEHDGAAPMDE